MKKTALLLPVALLLTSLPCAAQGPLNPTNPPAPTMHTLEEIYQKVLSNEQKLVENEQKLVENRSLLLSLGAVPPTAGMVLVPAGTFTMGSSLVGGSAVPEHTVTLSSFYLSKYETTYQQWYDVKTWADANGYTFANAGKEGHNGTIGAAPTGASSEPVTTVSWRDAIVWCNAHSEQAGLTPAYTYSSAPIKDATDVTACDGAVLNLSASGYRLPTEAEWEYAARYQDGATWTPGDYLSGATSNYLDATASQAVAWYSANSGSATHDVGGKTANLLGVFDMSGNVWEWCWDWYGAYGAGPDTNPTGPGTGSYRVGRGGSWDRAAYYSRVGGRYDSPPGFAFSTFGFRAVLPPGQ